MDISEFMIGDWVQIRYCRKLKLGLDQFYARGCHELRGNPMDYFSTFDPIPLTVEMLVANGFVFDCVEYEYKLEGFPSVLVDYHSVCIYWQGHLLRFNYVHEFQHALRLCGLTELANNFKI